MSPFILTEFTSALVIDALPSALVIIVYAIQYNAFFMNVETVSYLFTHIIVSISEKKAIHLAIFERDNFYNNTGEIYIGATSANV